MREIIYNRNLCLEYAKRYAYIRNPRYYNFDKIGGNCTNYASQCLFAGLPIMNYAPLGWYYNSASDRSPSWTSVESFCDFITTNTGVGPYGKIVELNKIEIGDFIQLATNGDYFHTLVITDLSDGVKVCSNTIDSFMRPLNTYYYANIRFIKILGGRSV